MKSQRMPWKDFLAQRQAVLDTWPTGRDVADIEDGLRYQRAHPRGQELRQGHEQGQGRRPDPAPAPGRRRPDRRPHPAAPLPRDRGHGRPPADDDRRLHPAEPLRGSRPRHREIPRRRHVAPQRLPGRQPRPRRLPQGHRGRHQADPGPARHARRAAAGRDLARRRLHLATRAAASPTTSPTPRRSRSASACATGSTSTGWSGYYEENGVSINREPFGPLTGTLVPPFISPHHRHPRGPAGPRAGRQVASPSATARAATSSRTWPPLASLRELADEYFREAGFDGLRPDPRLPPVDGRLPRGRGQGLRRHQPGRRSSPPRARSRRPSSSRRTRPWASRPRKPTPPGSRPPARS